MPLSINTNIASLTAQRAMINSNAGLESAFERLSTGKRINSAADDAAGLAIGKDLESRVSGLNQAVRNVNDGISMVQIAEGALDEATTILQRMRDLSVQAANGSLTTVEQGYLDTEHQKLAETLGKVIDQSQFNGTDLVLDTAKKTIAIQSGADASDTMNIVFAAMTENALGVDKDSINLAGSGASSAETATITGFDVDGTQAKAVHSLAGLSVATNNARTVNFGTVSNEGNVDVNDVLTVTIDGTAYTHTSANVSNNTELLAELNAADVGTDGTGGTLLSTVGQFSTVGGELVFTYSSASAVIGSGANTIANGGEGSGSLPTLGGTGSGTLSTAVTGTYTVNIGGSDFTTAAIAPPANLAALDDILNGISGVSALGTFAVSGSDLIFTHSTKGAQSSAVTIASTGFDTDVSTTTATINGTGTSVVGAVGTTAVGDVYTLTVGTDTYATSAATATTQYNTNKEIADGLQLTLTNEGITHYTIDTVGGTDFGDFVVTYAEEGNQGATTYTVAQTAGSGATDSTGKTISDGASKASDAIDAIDKALAKVASERATLGATQQQLESTVRNLANVAENTSAAAGRIMDTDYAAETANLTKAQILQQAATSILAQANAQPQSVLSLLQ